LHANVPRVQGIDLSNETLVLLTTLSSVSPATLASHLPTDKPSYTFYHYPSTSSVLFIYNCPSASKIKERMLFASSRSNILLIAKDEGVEVAKRLEASDPDDVSEEVLRAEAVAQNAEAADEKKAFSRPKRPGRR
jgi:twinfilin